MGRSNIHHQETDVPAWAYALRGSVSRKTRAWGISLQLDGSASEVTPPTQIPVVPVNIPRPPHLTGSSALTWQQLKLLPIQSTPSANNHKEPTALVESAAATVIEVKRSPTVEGSPAAMPLTPIPPPPPLAIVAQHPKRPWFIPSVSLEIIMDLV